MLGWSGFIGELVEFTITKIAYKKLDLILDQQKYKCALEAFSNLRKSLEQFEEVSIEFIYQSHEGLSRESQRVLYLVPIQGIARGVDVAFDRFFNAFEDLQQIISLYDKELHKMLWGIHLDKRTIVASLLSTLLILKDKNSFAISTNPQSVFFVDYSAPSEELLNANLEKLYQSIQKLNLPNAEANSLYTLEFSQSSEIYQKFFYG